MINYVLYETKIIILLQLHCSVYPMINCLHKAEFVVTNIVMLLPEELGLCKLIVSVGGSAINWSIKHKTKYDHFPLVLD